MSNWIANRLIVDVDEIVVDARFESGDELRNQNYVAVVAGHLLLLR